MKKVKVIFHIGAGKTGSSSIQKTLKENYELLANNGVIYAGMNFEGFCSKNWNKQPWGYNSLNSDELIKEYCEQLELIVNTEKPHTIILSNEGYLAHSEKLISLYQHLKESYELALYAYVRSPENWMISGYQQWGIKHKHYPGKILSAKEYISKNPYAQITNALELLNTNGMLDSLVVRSVEKVNNVVSDFLSLLQLKGLKEYKENESLSERDKCLAYFYNNQIQSPVLPNESNVLIQKLRQYSTEDIINKTLINTDTFDENIINSEKEKLNLLLSDEECYSLGVNINENYKNINNKDLIQISQYCVEQYSITQHLNPSFLRDIAISLEDVDMKSARYIMSLARLIRPNGPFINEKIAEYNKALTKPKDE